MRRVNTRRIFVSSIFWYSAPIPESLSTLFSEDAPSLPPVRQTRFYIRPEPGTMSRLQQMTQLMNYYILQTFLRIQGKPCIDPDPSGIYRTASPPGFHLPQDPFLCVNLQYRFPPARIEKNSCKQYFLLFRGYPPSGSLSLPRIFSSADIRKSLAYFLLIFPDPRFLAFQKFPVLETSASGGAVTNTLPSGGLI